MFNPNLRLAIFALAIFSCSLLAVPSFADSQARIVRLSVVEGDVQVNRNLGQGYEKAFLNLPITQGVKVRTNSDGRAEVEFEDGSTLRLTPGTVVEFPELSLRDSGTKLSTVNLVEGTAYVNVADTRSAAKLTGGKNNNSDTFTLTFAHEKLALTNSAHLRVHMGDTDATVAVFKGDVQVEGPSGSVQIAKKESATFNLADQDHYTLAKNLEQDPYDLWDKQQQDYHQRYVSSSSSYNSGSPYAYGASDMNYYGSYFNAPGYGTMWQPYFAGAGWDPFMNGAWVYDPAFGYSWVSSYPWGWTPYRYGSWNNVPGYGWAWQPGNSWAGWNNLPRVSNPPAGFVTPQPPVAPGNPVVVTHGPVPVVPGASADRVMIRNNSAGMGIARGTVKNLAVLSQQAKKEGFAAATVHTMPTSSSAARSSAISRGSAGSTGSASKMAAPSRSIGSRSASAHSMSTPHSGPRSTVKK